MTDAFEFVDGGRTFTCCVEELRSSNDERWWWFRVSTERSQRYAPFRKGRGDTREGVQARIVAYYDEMLVRRAMPAATYRRGRPPRSAAAGSPEVLAAPPEQPVAERSDPA